MKQNIRRKLEGCVLAPVLAGMLIYIRLSRWLNPTIIRLTEKGGLTLFACLAGFSLRMP